MEHIEKCVTILKAKGPMLGSELAKELCYVSGIKSNYARLIIKRAGENNMINSTFPVKFQKQEMIYSLAGQRIDKKLKTVIYDKSVKMARLLDAMVDNNGFLTYEEFCKISAGFIPEAAQYDSKHKTVDTLLLDMRSLGIIKSPIESNGYKFVLANAKWTSKVWFDDTLSNSRIQSLDRSKIYTKELLLWVERLNIAGWNTTKILENEEHGKNGFWWDAYGFSYIWGLYKSKSVSGTFDVSTEKSGSLIVVESVLHRQMKSYDVAGFIDRVDMVYHRLSKRDNFRIIPICFAISLESEAFDLAKSKGIIIASVSEVFGTKIAEALMKIDKIDLKNINPEEIGEILKVLEGQEDGRFGNLKGYVFNFLVSSFMNIQGYGTPRIGRKYNFDGQECEVDIIFELEDDLVICETKGYNKSKLIKLGVDSDESDSVRKFFEKTVEIVRKCTGKNVIPLFIASCYFEDDAIEYMEQKMQTKKIKRLLENPRAPKVIYYNHESLLEMLSQKSVYSEHRKVIKEYFK